MVESKAAKRRKRKTQKEDKKTTSATVLQRIRDAEEELHQTQTEDVISASEDEGGDDEERKHSKLLDAIRSLGGKRRKKLTERSEASIQVSEFAVNAEGEGDKIHLSELIENIDKASTSLSKAKQRLNKLKNHHSTLDTPLNRKEAEQIQREVAFEKTSKLVSGWEHVVNQNQRAEQLVFPLKQELSGPKRMEHVVSGWKAQTPLEKEIFSLLHANNQPVHDVVLTAGEESSIKAMSLEEAKLRRAELQKFRALQSYYEAKAKRQKKIKSKTYHKIQHKVLRKDYLKHFDELLKTDPDAALEELNKAELSRMKERMTLKHQNSGKWAKSRAIMAKYDEGARKAMQQQLEVNKDLTLKLVIPTDEDEEDEEESVEALPSFVNDAEPIVDAVNPWMRGKLSTEPALQEESNDMETSGARPGNVQAEEEANHLQEVEEEVEETEEEAILRGFEERRKMRRVEDVEVTPMFVGDNKELPAEKAEAIEVSDDDDDNDNEEEEAEISTFTRLFQGLVKNHVDSPAETAKMGASICVGQDESPTMLDEGLVRVMAPEDLELLSQGDASLMTTSAPRIEQTDSQSETQHAGEKKRKIMIDPNEVLTKEAKVIKVPFAPTAVDDVEGMEEQRVIIKEAFAGDDVVSDFLKDKEKQEEARKPKDLDLTLPGWGEWGGIGLKPSNRKRRFLVQAAEPTPRRDLKLPNVIFSEKRDSSIARLQVCQLPFPFRHPKEFEHVICSPIGHTWNTQNAVQKITAPKVMTKLGTIIEPMSREKYIKNQELVAPGRKSDQYLESDKGTQNKKRSQQKKKHKPKKN
ncbi:hypothetical protein UPYG_G00116250 [Umbra pygmaea]|uniref:U3 small nucleolar RNA-associated protein 14 homolog A n=1 Tax=Umbra pygmaea TaxID=75934 RepID=A0ABD0X468_UMBPY